MQLTALKVWSHLPLFCTFSQVQSSNFNRNPHNQEFHTREKDVPSFCSWLKLVTPCWPTENCLVWKWLRFMDCYTIHSGQFLCTLSVPDFQINSIIPFHLYTIWWIYMLLMVDHWRTVWTEKWHCSLWRLVLLKWLY